MDIIKPEAMFQLQKVAELGSLSYMVLALESKVEGRHYGISLSN